MANRNEKKARVIIVKLNKVDFKTNSVTKDKQRHLLLLFSPWGCIESDATKRLN